MSENAPLILEKQEMFQVVKHAPLVSMDMIIRNGEGLVLLGYRTNQPARNTWFVPGGRICKNERLSAAAKRISQNEFGCVIPFEDFIFKGVYEHLYPDNFTGEEKVGTHYVVLAYETTRDVNLKNLPGDQHSKYQWFSVRDILEKEDVHDNTKAYFYINRAET